MLFGGWLGVLGGLVGGRGKGALSGSAQTVGGLWRACVVVHAGLTPLTARFGCQRAFGCRGWRVLGHRGLGGYTTYSGQGVLKSVMSSRVGCSEEDLLNRKVVEVGRELGESTLI